MRMKENLALKILAFLLAVAAFTGAALMAWYQIVNVDVIWWGDSPADGYTISYLQWEDYNTLRNLLNLYNREAEDDPLSGRPRGKALFPPTTPICAGRCGTAGEPSVTEIRRRMSPSRRRGCTSTTIPGGCR